MTFRRCLPFALAISLSGSPLWAQDHDGILRVIAVDVEGGAATLYVTPQNHAILVDTGWPAGLGGPPSNGSAASSSSAERIAAAAKAAGIEKIDYLIVTHFHVDHVGGLPELLKLMPVDNVLDHGPNRENPPLGAPEDRLTYASATLYKSYQKAIAGLPHRVLEPGDTLSVDGLDVTVTNSAGALISTSLPGGGMAGSGCDKATAKAQDGGDENARSVGLFMRWGEARIFAGGDTTWNVENALVCPTNRIGPVDLYIGNHHGSGLSNSPAFVSSIAPRVVIFDNGPAKGGDASSFEAVRASARLQALWQLHGVDAAPERNEPEAHIANLTGGTDGAALTANVGRDGTIAIANPRRGAAEVYSAGKSTR